VAIEIRIVNLETGLPTVEQARTLLAEQLRKARADGTRLLKLIHGYGSSGVGGALRDGLLGTLGRLQMQREIAGFVAGEDWRISDATTWALLKRYPGLRRDSDLGRGNRGITIVVL
jgi:DNA-nicking Smr family endonuclease